MSRFHGTDARGAGERADGFHSLDYGLELTTDLERVFSSIWEVGGSRSAGEGITFREEPLRPTRLCEDGAFSIWDVTRTGGWEEDLASRAVSQVRLLWAPTAPPPDLCRHAVELIFDRSAAAAARRDAPPVKPGG